MLTAPPLYTSHGTAAETGAEEPKTAASDLGRYCYLFPDLADDDSKSSYGDPQTTHNTLRMISRAMAASFKRPGGTKLAPVYTYFGQFVSHDTTAPVSAKKGRFNIPASGLIRGLTEPKELLEEQRAARGTDVLSDLRNQQKQPLSLYSLYGDGPFKSSSTVREFYEEKAPVFKTGDLSGIPKGAALAFVDVHKLVPASGARDLPRAASGPHRPLIVDLRNDDNLIIGQLHLAMMLFHNRLYAALAADQKNSRLTPEQLFEETRRLVTWHYQWIVIHDYLGQLLHEGATTEALAGQNGIPAPGQVSLECTTAAFRFGHSMVSESYDFNDNFTPGGPGKTSASLHDLFQFTSHGQMGDGSGNTRQLPSHWVPDWRRLTMVNKEVQAGTDPIDPILCVPMAAGLDAVEDDQKSIAFRNMLRGYHRRIPFGQHLAEKLGQPPLPAAALEEMIPEGAGFDRQAVLVKTPAWLYFLCESKHMSGGKALGPSASRIIAHTLIGLMLKDQNSVLTAGRSWDPEQSPLRTQNKKPVTALADLLDAAGVMMSEASGDRSQSRTV